MSRHVTSYHVMSRHVTSYRITSAPTGENRPPRHERQKAFRPRNAWPTMTHLRHSVADRGQQGVVKHAHGTAPVRRADEILERKVDRHSVLKLCVGRGSRLAVWPNGQLHSGLITRKAAKSDDANASFHHIPTHPNTFQHIPTHQRPWICFADFSQRKHALHSDPGLLHNTCNLSKIRAQPMCSCDPPQLHCSNHALQFQFLHN